MYVLDENADKMGRWIKDEIEFPGVMQKGNRGWPVRRIQEWLCLHGLQLVIDGDYGAVTERAVSDFRVREGESSRGVVDKRTWQNLIEPMLSALSPIQSNLTSFGQAVISCADQQLRAHPREIGGQNCGPWVRLYMRGEQGVDWPWCAGFVRFCMALASENLRTSMPIKGSISCDTLAAQGRAAGLFVAESKADFRTLSPGSIFLARRTSTDWIHTGFVRKADSAQIETIEGNTNDDGHREGYEVCGRRRGYKSNDFIVLV